MIEVGKVYILNAPWHWRHGRHTLVVHARLGVSESCNGEVIYHIVDDDTFSSEPEWKTEYLPENFVDAGIDVQNFFKLQDDYEELKDYTIMHNEYYKIAYRPYHPYGSQSYKCEYNYSDPSISNINDSFYTKVIPGFLTFEQIRNLRSYYDQNNKFIELTPPN